MFLNEDKTLDYFFLNKNRSKISAVWLSRILFYPWLNSVSRSSQHLNFKITFAGTTKSIEIRNSFRSILVKFIRRSFLQVTAALELSLWKFNSQSKRFTYNIMPNKTCTLSRSVRSVNVVLHAMTSHSE